MNPLVSFLIDALPFLGLLGIGFLAGRIAERRHVARLAGHERDMASMLVTDLRSFPGALDGRSAADPILVTGEAVVATDYFKSFAAKLRKILGGELRSYQTLMDRARRQAMVNMLRSARDAGFDAVCNVRMETAGIGGAGMESRGMTTVAMMAWGTAYRRAAGPRPG